MVESKYSNLAINVSSKFYIKHCLLSFLRKVLYKVPLLGKGFRFLGRQFVSFGDLGNEEKNRLRSIKLLREEQANPQKLGSPYGYKDEIYELVQAVAYRDEIEGNFKQRSGSKKLYSHIINRCSSLFKANANIKQFVNFGVSYAYIDSVLAKSNTGINFIGIDRSRFTRFFNENIFSDMKNMSFVAGDIFELLKNKKFSGGVFFHMRTLVLLPTKFIQELYKVVADAEFEYIIGLEPIGLSRETLKAYGFSEDPKPSVLLRGSMYIHNYPAILKDNNFSVSDIELVKTDHPHEDIRYLGFVARRY